MTRLKTERRDDLLYWILSSDDKVITLDAELFADLAAAMRDPFVREGAAGIVLTSDRTDLFCAGADVSLLEAIKTAEEGRQLASEGQALFFDLESLPVPVVAAIPGTCLGGGLELALACHARVASKGARLGLPEVRLGVLPGLGGTQRLPRLTGLAKALPLLLSGRTVRASKARAIGLVDSVVGAHALDREARRLVRKIPKRKARRLFTPLFRFLAQRKIPGGFEAPRRVLRVLGRGQKCEAKEFGDAVVSSESKHMLQLFQTVSACKRGLEKKPPRFVGVLGFGIMGAGIASALTRKGIAVRIRDVDDDSIVKGLQRFDGDRDLLTMTTGWEGFRAADIMIEAVLEDMPIKLAVLTEARRAAQQAVIMSNTSSLSIERLGVVGMHFFNPVKRMPLVEIVAAPGSVPASVDCARSLAVTLGKVPVVVKDCAGFLVNRILGRYLAAAMCLDASEDAIDAAARAYGFPMGPFEVLDMVGHDVARAVAQQLHDAYGERYPVTARFRQGKRKRARPADLAPALDALRDEADRCLREQIAGAQEIDLACVMGFGYPAWNQITDGAVALLVGDPDRLQGTEPLARVASYAYAGCDPKRMGLGPCYAIPKVLGDHSLESMEAVEINEAFAAQVLACLKALESAAFARDELGRDSAVGRIDPARLNAYGGAVALGHPVGASGARLLLSLALQMRRGGLQHGLASLCVGGGQGGAVRLQAK